MIFKILILSIALSVTFALKEIPEFMHICGRRNPKLSECVMNSTAHMLPWLRKGIPELDIPPTDPIFIDSVSMANQDTFKAAAKNIFCVGFSEYKILSSHADMDKNKFDFFIQFPHINCIGEFDLSIRIMVPFKGRGYINLVSDNSTAKIQLTWKLYERKGIKLGYFDSMKSKLDIKNFVGKFNITEGLNDPTILKAVDDSLKASEEEIIDLVTPNIEKKVSNLVLDIANKIIRHFSYDQLFPDHE